MRSPDKTREELAEAGQVLYGSRWQTDLASALGLCDARRVRQWLSGERKMPESAWRDIYALLLQRANRSITLATEILARLEPDPAIVHLSHGESQSEARKGRSHDSGQALHSPSVTPASGGGGNAKP